MANFPTSNLDLLSSSQAGKETAINDLFNAASSVAIYGYRRSTTTGLTWGYYGGAGTLSGVASIIPNGTVDLTASSTNYVGMNRTSGLPEVNTTGWTDVTHKRLYEVVTNASAVVSYIDWRSPGAGTGSGPLTDSRILSYGTPSFSVVLIPDPTGSPGDQNQIGVQYSANYNLILGGKSNEMNISGSGSAGSSNLIIGSLGSKFYKGTTGNVKIGNSPAIIPGFVSTGNVIITAGSTDPLTYSNAKISNTIAIGNVGNSTMQASGCCLIVCGGGPVNATKENSSWFGPGGADLLRSGEYVWSNRDLSSTWKSLSGLIQFAEKTTNATPKEVFLQSGGTTSDRFFLPQNCSVVFRGIIQAKQSSTSAERACWQVSGLATRDTGSVSIQGFTSTLIYATSGMSAASFSFAGIADAMTLTATGISATVYWHGMLQTSEVRES